MPQDLVRGERFYKQDYELDIPTGIPSEMLERRPDIKQAEALFQVQNAQIGISESMRWPSLNLTAALGLASPDLVSLNAYGLSWSVGSFLFGPLFQFGKNKRRVEMSVENAKTALLQYEQTTLQAFREVEDALISIETYKEELVAQESRTTTAMGSEGLAQVRYAEGSTTYLEVLEQQRQSFSAQLDLLTNRYNLLNSYILLYKSLGGGWLSPEEEKAYMEEGNDNSEIKN
jgi:multidrug efflux system outer membrane protein